MAQQQFHHVGGPLEGNNTWGNDTIPYYVDDDIYIKALSSLTIMPGTTIFFENTTGIFVKGGGLTINGQDNDSVTLCAYSHKWSGIEISGNSTVTIRYAHFKGAENAIVINKNDNVNVFGCYLEHVYYKGISITNSKNCEISNCKFYNNHKAIILTGDISGNPYACKNNIIKNNKFIEGEIGLILQSANWGSCSYNTISNNFFGGISTSLYFKDSNPFKTNKNFVNQNVITSISNEPLGTSGNTGIYLSMDSVYIENNIFWKNENPILFKGEAICFINKNTFYENVMCIKNNSFIDNGKINDNVFLKNIENICDFEGTCNADFYDNNFLITDNLKPLFHNKGNDTIDLSNNYWNTTNDSIINSMIYDHQDDSLVGPIIFDPVLEDFSTIAPVSPPIDVTKQSIDNGILVKWKCNRENDLKNYRLYYGDFMFYSFENKIDGIQDTSYFLTETDILNNIAVTSIDTCFSEEEGQNKGHESAFSFAIPIPFAGNDDSICQQDEYYYITDANIPRPYSALSWMTSGTGFFENPDTIVTKYYPSEEDFTNGSVTLTLVVDGSLESAYSDSFNLKLIKSPTAFAGDDKINIFGSPIEIKDSYTSYSQIIEWKSLGDGYFDDENILKPKYYYGEQDSLSKQVELILNVYSYCGNTADTVTYYLVNAYNIEGRVHCNDTAVQNSIIVAVSINNRIINKLYKTKTDIDGHFEFNKMIENEYILYAVPDTIDKVGAPTYYADRNTWEQAHHIILDGNVFDVDIYLPTPIKDFPQGTGSISGKFDYPELSFVDTLFYCDGWFEQDTSVTYCDGGLSNIIISLYNSHKTHIIDYAVTDEKGNFKFSDLPFGAYYIMTDIPRYKTSIPQILTISPEHPEIKDIHFFIDANDRLVIRLPNQSEQEKDNDLTLFPNPCDKECTLGGNLENGIYHVEIYNTLGVKIFNCCVSFDQSVPLTFSTSDFPNGIYLIKIYNSNKMLYINTLFVRH